MANKIYLPAPVPRIRQTESSIYRTMKKTKEAAPIGCAKNIS